MREKERGRGREGDKERLEREIRRYGDIRL